LSKLTISAPPLAVRLMISSTRAWVVQPIFTRSGTGIPATAE